MTAGYNLILRVWRIFNLDDDDVGGAQLSGTHVGDVHVSLSEEDGAQILVQQGYETTRQFTFNCHMPTFLIMERDEVEIIWPGDHFYVNDRFRIERVRHSRHSPRNRNRYMMLRTTRSVESHAEQ